MKTYSTQRKVVVKAGSVSRSEARAAARAAKPGHYLRVARGDVGEVGSLWERYLGHFGGTAKKASRSHSGVKSGKKSSAKKSGQSAKKVVAKKHSPKKVSTKKR